MGPYEEFESKTKELLQLIDEPISLIDAQIKEMEEQRKAARRKEIEEFFGDIASDLLEYVSLDQIYDSHWENASTSTKAWKTDLTGQVSRIRNDIEVIKANTSEAVPKALEEYKKTHDLSKASMAIAAYERQKEEILKREEERRRAREEQKQDARPTIAGKIESPEAYDTIFIGYPNWWGDMPMILYTFLEQYDFSGKTIIPFCTHGGSGFSRTIRTMQDKQPGATVIRNGYSLSRSRMERAPSGVAEWLKEIGLKK